MKYFLCWSILNLLFTSCLIGQQTSRQIILGEKYARDQINITLKEISDKPKFDTLIRDKRTAIEIAEPILFKIYGKELISGEQPYETYFIDGYWYIAGTLRKGKRGGTFEIIFSAYDGKIIKLKHYQ